MILENPSSLTDADWQQLQALGLSRLFLLDQAKVNRYANDHHKGSDELTIPELESLAVRQAGQ